MRGIHIMGNDLRTNLMTDIEARVKIENAMRINYSDEQWSVVNDTNRPSSVVSCAGSGKTTVLIARLLYKELVEGIKPYRMLVITFNKKASEEIEERYHLARRRIGLPNFNPSFHTFHAFFLRLLRSDVKYEDYTVSNSSKYFFTLADMVKTHQTLKSNIDLVKDILATRSYGINNKKDYLTHNEFGDMGVEVIKKYEELLEENEEMDFDDMLLLLYREIFEHQNQDIIDIFKESYDLVLIDEFQDISGIQYDIIEELVSAIGMNRLTVIGDDDQASLVGSKVLMQGGVVKNVEDIEIGDRVVSYKMGDSFSLSTDTKFGKGYEVLDKRMHSEEGALEVVTESGHRSTYSQGHKAIAKLSCERDDYILYMMRNHKGHYRIGVSRIYANEGSHVLFGLKNRMRREKATEGWVLKLYKTKREAMRDEQLYSYEFGVPRNIFNVDTAGVLKDESDEDYVFENISNLEGKALRMLECFGRDVNYPLCSKVDERFNNVHYTSNASFVIRACNLIPEMFDMVVRNPDNSIEYSKLKEVNYIEGMHDFVSLKVDGYKTYVADNIATHNCIYEFRGSNPQYITQFGNMLPSAQTHLLTVNFRCPQAILSFVAPSIYKNNKRVAKALRSSMSGGTVDFLGVKADEPLVQTIIEDYRNNKEVAILVRNNHQKTVISDKLVRRGVPVDMGSSSYTLKNNQVFKRLTMLIDLIRESNNNGFIKYHWLFRVSRHHIPAIKARYRGSEEYWVEDVLERDMWDVPNRMKGIIRNMLQEDEAEKLYTHAMDFYRDSFVSGARKGFYNMDSVNDYYNYIVEDFARGLTYAEFKEKVNYNQRFVDRNLGNKKAIQVATMHTVKGLEYDTVVVYDPSDADMFPEYRGIWEKGARWENTTENEFKKGVFNYNQTYLDRLASFASESNSEKVTLEDVKDRIESERRLFYVACTRAKDRLIIATDIDRRSSVVMEALAHRGEVEIPVVKTEEFVERSLEDVEEEVKLEKETKEAIRKQRERERQERMERRNKGLTELESLLGNTTKETEVDKSMTLGSIGNILGMGDDE